MDCPLAPWPLFVARLIANGWFLRPQAFAQRKAGPSAGRRIRTAMLRLGVFCALWIAALATLPTLPVAAALVAWIAWIIPKVRWVNLEFQNLAEG